MQARYDVVVVGAGPAGSTAAYYLARHGAKVLLLDKHDFPRDKTCGDALTPSAVGALADIGILPEMRMVSRRVREVRVIAPDGHSVVVPMPRRHDRPDYSLVVPRLVLDNALKERALASGAHFRSPVHVTRITVETNGARVYGNRRDRKVNLQADLVIIATGASTRLMQRCGIPTRAPPGLAVRAYFDGMMGVQNRLDLHLLGVATPGYGWAFPLSDSEANVGVGLFPFHGNSRFLARKSTAHGAMDLLFQSPVLGLLLKRARRVGPVKSYPLRADFATAPTYGDRILMVGEAAGLVNPLTGEGIDYALESGKLAADFVMRLFAKSDLSEESLAEYDRLLRERYQSLFVFCGRATHLFASRLALNLLVSWAERRADLAQLLTNIVLGNVDVPRRITALTILKTLRGT